jgi:thioredoxin-like negative regulator of GroEL
MNVTEWHDKSGFQKSIATPGRHLVVFAAKWCGFCTRFIGQAKNLQSSSELLLVDADEPDESLWDDYSIRIVPTLAVFQNGQIIFRRDGKSGMGLRVSDLEEAISQAS